MIDVWKRGTAEPDDTARSEQILEKIDAPRGNVKEVSGRVEGQTLRGSLQQKRKEEGPKDSMSFEEAVVSAIDFTGALTGTGSYAPPQRSRAAEHLKARAWDLRRRIPIRRRWPR